MTLNYSSVLGLIPVITTILGLLEKRKERALLWLFIGNAFFLLQYAFGGAYPQAFLYVVNTARIGVFRLYESRGKVTPGEWLLAFSVPGLIMGGYLIGTSSDYWSLVTIVAGIVATWGTWQQLPHRMRWLRASFIVAPFLNLLFDATHGFNGWVPYALQVVSSAALLFLKWNDAPAAPKAAAEAQ